MLIVLFPLFVLALPSDIRFTLFPTLRISLLGMTFDAWQTILAFLFSPAGFFFVSYYAIVSVFSNVMSNLLAYPLMFFAYFLIFYYFVLLLGSLLIFPIYMYTIMTKDQATVIRALKLLAKLHILFSPLTMVISVKILLKIKFKNEIILMNNL